MTRDVAQEPANVLPLAAYERQALQMESMLHDAGKELDRALARVTNVEGFLSMLEAALVQATERGCHRFSTSDMLTAIRSHRATAPFATGRYEEIRAAGLAVLAAVAEQPLSPNAVRDPAIARLRAAHAAQPSPDTESGEPGA